MPHPKGGYVNAAGVRIPGVTTIISGNLGWSRGALMYWAWQQGRDGKDFRETTQTAADVGTLGHAMVDAHLRQVPFDPNGAPAEFVERAKVSFGAYLEWEENSRVEIVASEIMVISERHQFGGTPDAVLLTKRGLALGDWKTGAAIHEDHLMQTSAYLHALEEVTGLAFVGGVHIFRFDKIYGGFLHKWVPRDELAMAWRAFLLLRELHDMQKPLKALAK